jgi:hypothetical protein
MNILQAHTICKLLNANILRPKYPEGEGGYPTLENTNTDDRKPASFSRSK